MENSRYELFAAIERITGKGLVESELDEIEAACQTNAALRAENEILKREKENALFQVERLIKTARQTNAALRAENAKLREALELITRSIKRLVLAEKENKNTMVPVWSLEQNVIAFEKLLNSTNPDPLYLAAPEMLEAFEKCLEFLEEGHLDIYTKCRSIISRAKGETA